MTSKHYTLGFFPLLHNSYRRFCWLWWKEYLNPSTYWRTLKYFCQRGWRGYADCDHWDADSYFEVVMVGVLRRLRDSNFGFPAHMSDFEMGEQPSEGAVDTGSDKWNAILTEIIEGLEAAVELRFEETVPKGTYSDEPIEWVAIEGLPDMMRMKDTGIPRFNPSLYEQWAEPLKAKKKRAFELLVEHWGSFWD